MSAAPAIYLASQVSPIGRDWPREGVVFLDVLFFSFNVTMPVVLNMALGVFLRQSGMLDEASTKTINDLCFGVFMPVIMFKNIYDIDFHATFYTRLMLFAILALAAMLIILMIVVRFFVKERAFYFTCVHVAGRPNYVMFGLALMFNMYGDEGVRIASMLTPVAVIPFNFIGVILISLAMADPDLSMPRLLRETAVKCLTNPIIVGALLGLAMAFSGLRLPIFLANFIDPLSKVGSPLALLLLGAQMDLQSLKKGAASVAVVSATKLILVPLLAMTAAVMLGFRGLELAVLLIYFASPIGVACTVLAQHYDVHVKFTAQVVTVTSMLSGVSMFIWISLMRYLQFL